MMSHERLRIRDGPAAVLVPVAGAGMSDNIPDCCQTAWAVAYEDDDGFWRTPWWRNVPGSRPEVYVCKEDAEDAMHKINASHPRAVLQVVRVTVTVEVEDE